MPETVDSVREVWCRNCGGRFYVCPAHDRGQAYCSDECREDGIKERRREANQRHQQTADGRRDHARRQQEYRDRNRLQIVTDNCSENLPSDPDPVPRQSTAGGQEKADEQTDLGRDLAGGDGHEDTGHRWRDHIAKSAVIPRSSASTRIAVAVGIGGAVARDSGACCIVCGAIGRRVRTTYLQGLVSGFRRPAVRDRVANKRAPPASA